MDSQKNCAQNKPWKKNRQKNCAQNKALQKCACGGSRSSLSQQGPQLTSSMIDSLQ